MNWSFIQSEDDLDKAIKSSETKAVLIYKYSSNCSISDRVQDILESDWDGSNPDEKLSPYFLDLIKYRKISNEIARRFGVEHESPQVLIIKNDKCIYNESHGYIRLDEILKAIN